MAFLVVTRNSLTAVWVDEITNTLKILILGTSEQLRFILECCDVSAKRSAVGY